MTLKEYRLRMLAQELREVDEEYKRHEMAFLQQAVQATEKNGNPKFKKFKDFFDYQKEINDVLQGTAFEREQINAEKKARIQQRMKRLEEYRKRKEDN